MYEFNVCGILQQTIGFHCNAVIAGDSKRDHYENMSSIWQEYTVLCVIVYCIHNKTQYLPGHYNVQTKFA